MYPSLLLLCIIPQRFARDQNGVERGCFLCHLWCVACRLAWTVPHWLSGAAYEKYPLCVWEGGGERGTNMAAAGILRFLCVHFVLAAHVVALNCGKLSTQQAACSMQQAACGMWHADWRKAAQAFTSILSCALQSFGTVHDNLCLILPIKPLHAHCESNRALVWP